MGRATAPLSKAALLFPGGEATVLIEKMSGQPMNRPLQCQSTRPALGPDILLGV
jgi:hypothetical protein